MKQSDLFKKILPGFIPLFVFIVADEIWGTKTALIVALITGLSEMIYSWVKERKVDWFVMFDTALLVLFSGVSILLDNDIFFKIKPGFIELIMVAILGFSAFSKMNLVGVMTQRYMKNVELNDYQVKHFRNMMRKMFWIFLGHTMLVFYSAFYMSKGAWVFISGGLFYILFGVFIIVEWFKNKAKKKNYTNEEWLPIVNEKGKVLGQAPRSECHKGNKIMHPVVHLHVINHKSQIFLQKRPQDKLIQPGKWDTAVGGHIAAGEDLKESLEREANEEIGLKKFSANLISTYKWETDVEVELVYLFVTKDYDGIKIEGEEVEEGKFWQIHEIEKMIGKNIFTPNFEMEYRLLKENNLM